MVQFNPTPQGGGNSSTGREESPTTELRERCATELISYSELFTKLMPHTLSLLVEMLQEIKDLPVLQKRDSEPQKKLSGLFAEVQRAFANSDLLCKALAAANSEQELLGAICTARIEASKTLELVSRAESFLLSHCEAYHRGIRQYTERCGEAAVRHEELTKNEFAHNESLKDAAAQLVVNLRVLAQSEQQSVPINLADMLALTSSRGVFVKQALQSKRPVPAVLDVVNAMVTVADAFYSSMVSLQRGFSANEKELAAYLSDVDGEELVTNRLRGLESLIAAPVPLNAEVCEEGIKFSYSLPQAAELLGIELTQATKHALDSESRELERRGMHSKVVCGFEGESFVVTVLLDVPVAETLERVKPETMRVMRRDAWKKREIVGGDFVGFDFVRYSQEPSSDHSAAHQPASKRVLGVSFPRSMTSSKAGRKFLSTTAPVASRLADVLGVREWILLSHEGGAEEFQEEDDHCIDPSAFAVQFLSLSDSDEVDQRAVSLAERRRYLEGWRKVPGHASEFTRSPVIEPLIVMPANYIMNDTFLNGLAAVRSVARIGYLDLMQFECTHEELLGLLHKSKEFIERIQRKDSNLGELIVWFDPLTGNVPFRELNFHLTDTNLTLIGRGTIGLDVADAEPIVAYPWVELARLNRVLSEVLGAETTLPQLVSILAERLREQRYSISETLVHAVVQNRIRSLEPFTPLQTARLVTSILRRNLDHLVIRADDPGFTLSIRTIFEAAS